MTKPSNGKASLPQTFLVAGIAIVFFAACLFVAFKPKADHALHMEVLPLIPVATNAPVLRVLFVGNSYIMVNDLPHVIANIAASDTEQPIKIQTGALVKPGTPLDELWNDHLTANPFEGIKWHYVVLHSSPMYATTPELIAQMNTSTKMWDAAIKQNGARTMLYEAWARKPGSSWYAKPPLKKYKTADDMQYDIDKATNALGREIGAIVVPVGDYWAACSMLPGAPVLYNVDGTHPTAAGTYLTALLFYRQFTGRTLEHITYISPRVSPGDAQFLIKCAGYQKS